MKVSIITPAYNCQDFIEKCILSVKNQSYKDIEHIIVNDGSSDETEKEIRKYLGTYDLKLISQKNGGIAQAMNAGFEAATGEIYAWLDADNWYYPDAVEKAVSIFKAEPKTDIVHGNITFAFHGEDRFANHAPPSDISFKKALIHTAGAIPLQPAVFFKKEIYEKAGGFDAKYKVAGDYDFWMKVLKENPHISYCDQALGFYTMVSSGASQSLKGIMRAFREMTDIGRKFNQPLSGRLLMSLKYVKGYASGLVNKMRTP